MKTEMTSFERVTALLNQKTPDRMGLMDHYWGETIPDYWLKQGFPENTDPGEYFDYDIRFVAGWLDSAPLYDLEDVTVDESDEWKLTKNRNGATLRWWKHKSGTPEHVDFDCTSIEKWEQDYKPNLLELNKARVNPTAMRDEILKARSLNKYSSQGNMFVFELLRGILGDVAMMENFALEPEWILDFCNTYTDFYIKHLEYLYDEAGVQPDSAFIYEDLGYSKGLYCSPNMYRELIQPSHKRLVDFFHNRDMKVVLHSCGRIVDGVEAIIEAGFDCLQPMEAKCGNNVIDFATKYPGKIAFMGNIDVRALESGDEKAMDEEIRPKMRAMKEKGTPYFFHTDHSISPLVTLEAYRYALKVYREECEY